MMKDLIKGTIERGAPLYNSGDIGSCAELYHRTAKQIAASEVFSAFVYVFFATMFIFTINIYVCVCSYR